MKRIEWLDTLRVLASLLVVFSHYVYTVEGTAFDGFAREYLWSVGLIGVTIFFAISGYLAANSLERTPSLKEFYRRKFIRIMVPYATAYVICLAAYLLLAFLFPKFTDAGLFAQILAEPKITGFLLGVLPIDINLMKFFDLTYYNVVGEWFIGTVVLLYLIAPLLYTCLKKNPIETVAVTVIIALATFDWTMPLVEQQRIATNLWLFTARAPEFLAGMILFRYKDSLLNCHSTAIKILAAVTVIFSIQQVQIDVTRGSIWQQLFLPYSTKFICASFLAVYLSYLAANWLNEIFPAALSKFNGFSKISYMTMLVHHLIVYQLAHIFNHSSLDGFEFMLIFLLILAATIVASEIFWRIYKPIEEKLIKG